jgi:hypothetical protein
MPVDHEHDECLVYFTTPTPGVDNVVAKKCWAHHRE